jgi:hypothetical protein
VQSTTVVDATDDWVEVHQDGLAPNSDVTNGCKATDAVVDATGQACVVDVDEAVACEVRVERDAEDASLSSRVGCQRNDGVARSTPFLTTRTAPVCSVMKMRPSGANAIAVGRDSVLARTVSLKPGGTVAAYRGVVAGDKRDRLARMPSTKSPSLIVDRMPD